MKFNDIPAKIISIRVKTTEPNMPGLKEQPVMDVSVCLSRHGEFEIRLKNSMRFIKPTVDTDIRRLGSELAIGRAMLAQLANPAADGSIELQMSFFTGECLEMGDVEIGVDEYVQQRIGKIFRKNLIGEKLYSALEEYFCLVHNGQEFFLLVAGPAIDDVLKSEPEEKSEEALEERGETDDAGESEGKTSQSIGKDSAFIKAPNRKNSFCVTGDGIRFVATETPLSHGNSVFIATRLTTTRDEQDRAVRLAKGKLKFVDWTKAGQIQLLAKAQISALTKDDGSYLKKWDEFGDLEGELLLKNAREIGALQYSDITINRDGTVSVLIAQASDSALDKLARSGVDAVEFVNEPPDYLTNTDLKFGQFVDTIEKGVKIKANPNFTVSGFDADSKRLTIETEILPSSGMLILSLAGEIAQIERRVTARKAILEGRAANPQLGLLIEEKGDITPSRPPQKIKPLTAFVRNKIFKNPPTLMQEKAIEVALNTPDIALIQGPPGTGKTTVIAAILERLNEMADKRAANMRGIVLLTGFQHDAVENMIDRISLNSLPVPKFGKKSGTDEDDYNLFERNLETWCTTIAMDLRARNPQIVEIEKEANIKNLCLQYLNAPTRTLAANLAKNIADLGIAILGDELSRHAATLANKLSLEERLDTESNPLLDAVRRLRIRPEGFADDGPERAADTLDNLLEVLEESERNLLKKASMWSNEDGPPPICARLGAAKKETPHPLHRSPHISRGKAKFRTYCTGRGGNQQNQGYRFLCQGRQIHCAGGVSG